jgi:hypothetical protein
MMLVLTACAASRHRIVARSVTLPQWEQVVECLTLNARSTETWVEASGNAVSIVRGQGRWGFEEIRFVREPTGLPAFRVSSRTQASDPSWAWRAPVSGPTPLTRRLQLQLDAQCLGSYPVADSSAE